MSPTRPVDNVVIATKGLQDRNTNIIAGTMVENKGKLILTVIYMYSQILLRLLSHSVALQPLKGLNYPLMRISSSSRIYLHLLYKRG